MRNFFASAITRFTSAMPEVTALNGTNRFFTRDAISRAIVVLPDPGGPHRIIDCVMRPASSAARSSVPGPTSFSCPTSSSSVRGRMRSASGVAGSVRARRDGSGGNRSNGSLMVEICVTAWRGATGYV